MLSFFKKIICGIRNLNCSQDISMPPKKKVLSQDDFDSTVYSNIDDFGMTEDEAVDDAVQTFNEMGFSVSNIFLKNVFINVEDII
jgi:hypothetical protein